MGLNNKKIGADFEKEVCAMLAKQGWWVHFIEPDIRGAQPFDIIAVKAGQAIAIDCKTCVANTFNISRMEDNQIMAFEKWLDCGNEMPRIYVKHDGNIYDIPYHKIKHNISVKLTDEWKMDQ